jgi:hypothetical protein
VTVNAREGTFVADATPAGAVTMTNRDLLARPARLAAAALALAAALLAPASAGAAVAYVSGFSNTPVATTGTNGTTSWTASGSFTPGAGTNRIVVVVVTARTAGSTGTWSASGTYNGVALTQATVTSASTNTGLWVGYAREANLPAGAATLSVTIQNAQTIQYGSMFAGTFSGVNQTTPVSGANQVSGNATTITIPAALASNAGGAYVAAVARPTGSTDTINPATFTIAAQNNTNVGSNVGYKLTATAASESTSSTLSVSGQQALGVIALNPAAAAGTITVGNNSGTEASSVTLCAAPSNTGYIDFFTLLASAATNVTGVTTTFSPALPANLLSLLEVTTDAGAAQGSASNPSGSNPAVSGMSFAAPTGPTPVQYRLRITPNTALTTSGTFTATVTGITTSGGFTPTLNDTGGASIIIDGQASPDVSGASATGTAGTVTANWTNPAAGTVPGTDFAKVIVLGNSVAITGVPTKGLDYTTGAVGADSILCAGPSIATCQKTGLASSSTYYMKIFTRDGCNNWSAGVSVQATTPAGPTTQLADGTNPANVTALSPAPTGGETPVDAFTFAVTPSGTDTIQNLTVTLAAGTSAGISQIRIMSGSNCTGTQYFGAVSNPGDSVTLSGGTLIPVTATATPYYVCITPKTHAAMPPPPGSVYAVTGTVTSYMCTNPKSGTDAGSATVNIDNASSPDVAGASATGGSGMVTANWANPGVGTAPGSDFGSYVVVLGNTVPVTNAPGEGTASYTAGGTIGADSIVCSGNITTCQKTALTAGQTYYMEIFTRDNVNNWSPGVVVSAAALDTRTTPVALNASVVSCGQVNLSASYTGDSPSNNTVTFARGIDGIAFGTPVCNAVGGGTNPRTCSDTAVSASTTYYYRATYNDAEGTVGGNTKDSGAVSVGACAATLTVAAGTMPGNAQVAPGSSGTVVGRIQLSPSAQLDLNSLTLSNTGTMAAGADISSVALFDVTTATTAYVGNAAWTGSRWDFQNLGYTLKSPTTYTFAVVLNVAAGAANGKTFIMNLSAPADVTVVAPATVSSTPVTIPGNTFTVNVASGTPGGNKALNAPMVSIINPASGNVMTGAFKVQIRVYNKVSNRGVDGVSSLTLSSGGAYSATGINAGQKYDTIDPGFAPTVTGRTYDATLTLAPGGYTLRARAQNTAGQITTSEPVQITVGGSRSGDGSLLVRDNSSQLCNDCHTVKTHSTETVGTTYGAWAVNCRDCHAPHRTRNIHLVSETIIPPSVAGTVLPAAKVGYVSQTGAIAGNGWNTSGSGSPTGTATFVNQGDNSGPCQVCHTRTQGTGGIPRWQNKGNADSSHYASTSTSPCADCHAHTAGFAPSSCLGCHGVTGTETVDLGANFWKNGTTKATINTAEWTYSGHGRPSTSGNYNVTGHTAANFSTSPSPGTSECLYCHDDAVSHKADTNPFRLRGVANSSGVTTGYDPNAAWNAPCLNCHNSAANYGVMPNGQALKKSTTFVDTAHDGSKHTGKPTLGGRFCWDCHDPHGDAVDTTGNIAMIRKQVQKVTDGTYGYLGASGVARNVTYTQFTGTSPGSGKAVENVTTAGTDHVGICQACHGHNPGDTDWTKYWDRQGYDQNTTPSAHNATSATSPYCISCHAHNKKFAGSGECISCHAGPQGIRRNVMIEFSYTWSHKRSASPARTVSNMDCGVCHMEGDPKTGQTTSQHADGLVDLRDPDTGTQIKKVSWNNGTPGAWTPDPTNIQTFVQFKRNLSNMNIEPEVAAIMINQCLHCHDANGASNAGAQVTGGSAGKPFNTNLSGTGYDGANGLTACASGTNGCVANVAKSFSTANASYHPVLGKNNNWYAKDLRMRTPWDMGITTRSGTANLTTWGPVISCFDCHAANNAQGIQTSTVTAHGGQVTLRQDVWVASSTWTGAVNAGNLCLVCHVIPSSASSNHGTVGTAPAGQSAFSTGGSGTPGGLAKNQCYYCHSSATTKPTVRPIPAEDAHGFDGFTYLMGSTDQQWPVGTTEQYKPYAFMRSVGASGAWSGAGAGNAWKPLSGPGVPAGTATCGSSPNSSCNIGRTYLPGGMY